MIISPITSEWSHIFIMAIMLAKLKNLLLTMLKTKKQCLKYGEISGETPSLVGCNIEGFTTRLVAIKAFFMNAIYELKQEIESFPRDKEILG